MTTDHICSGIAQVVLSCRHKGRRAYRSCISAAPLAGPSQTQMYVRTRWLASSEGEMASLPSLSLRWEYGTVALLPRVQGCGRKSGERVGGNSLRSVRWELGEGGCYVGGNRRLLCVHEGSCRQKDAISQGKRFFFKYETNFVRESLQTFIESIILIPQSYSILKSINLQDRELSPLSN